MTLQDTADEDTGSTDPAVTEPRRSAPRGLKLAVVGLAALSLGLAILAAALSAQNRDTTGRTSDVRRTAGAIGSAMLTYDYRRLDEYETRVKALATAEFAQEFDETYPAFAELYTLTKGSSKVRDINVFVGDVDGDDASAMVEVDYLVSGELAGQNSPRLAVFEVTLVETKRGWKVANLRPVQSYTSPNSAPTSTPGN